MYVRSVSVENFRHFEKAEVDFVYPGMKPKPGKDVFDNVTLLVGVNGSGKTSVLKAVALAVLAPILHASGYKPEYLVRRGLKTPKPAEVSGQLELHEPDWPDGLDLGMLSPRTNRIKIEQRGDYEAIEQVPRGHQSRDMLMYMDASPAYFILGYGATRRTERDLRNVNNLTKQRSPRYLRVAGLFEDQIALMPLAAWVPSLDRGTGRYRQVVQCLNATLPEGTLFDGEFDQGEPVFRHQGIKLPFGALSDGYRAYIGLIADMLYHMHQCFPKAKLAKTAGVVMVDDIDLHLHPEWQREVVPNLAKAFPRLQFILTSHSPLVAGTLHADNVRIIEDGKVRQSEERLHGLSADQILTSPYFGLPSPRSPDAEKRLQKIANQVADTGDPSKAIEFLRTLAGKDGESNGAVDDS